MPRRYPNFALTVAVLIALCLGTTPGAAQTSPDIVGAWSLVNPLPYFPIHTHLLPTGKVMIWTGDGGVSGDDPRSWDPADESVSSLSTPGYDTFCSGHSFLADGTLFVAGGHIQGHVGLSRASTYNPFSDTWSILPNMNAGRWYPTTTVLANGDVLVVSGDIDLTSGINTLPQVFQVSTGTWRDLTNAQLGQDLYPMMLLAPNGKVFNAGPTATTRYLDTAGSGTWNIVGTRAGGYRGYGSAVMYAPGKVLVMGGGQTPPTNTAEVIDLNEESPQWRFVGSMDFARRHLNATLLPDGKVLVTGGTATPGFNEPSGAVHAAELWDPATENWTTLASSSGIPRVYHSTALLLPDGRVLSTGGNGYPDTEIYSPPYLFKGTRPTITSAPPSVVYGQSFFVETPDAATISKITMLRLSSTTHAFNMSQHISDPSFAQATGGLSVTAPPSGNVAPPGDYLLFILNGSGVPSVAKILRIGAPADTTPPTVPGSLSATASGANRIDLSWIASTDDVGVTGYQVERCQGTGCTNFAQVTTVTTTSYSDIGLLAATTYRYRVRATDASGKLSAYSNTATAATTAGGSPAGLVAAYGFSEGSGTAVADASGNGNAGTTIGATWSAQGKYGSALVFNGTSARVNVPDAPTLDITAAMTLEAWVYPTATSTIWRTILAKEQTEDLAYALFAQAPTLPVAGYNTSTTSANRQGAIGPSALPLNTWTHLAGTYDGNTVRLYVNGAEVANQPATGAIITSTHPLSIGSNTVWGQYFTGRLDEIRVYGRALSPAEIQVDMNTPITAGADTTPPTVPGSLSATASGANRIDLSWIASTDDVGVT
ncbi:MAG: DUF1929 domain-containing protein, partial [Pseudomonadota bacterium]|nr:DUF1929 domain-containing protein [Pseudomonadota bacterium]